MEDANEDRVTPEAATAEAEAESTEEEEKAARRGKVVARTPVSDRVTYYFLFQSRTIVFGDCRI